MNLSKGAKNALRRRVNFELGCDLGAIEDINFMGKIVYSAEFDATWGESESKKLGFCFSLKSTIVSL